MPVLLSQLEVKQSASMPKFAERETLHKDVDDAGSSCCMMQTKTALKEDEEMSSAPGT